MVDEMRQLELNEFKQIQLKLLDEVAAFCDANDIHYWLAYGTLLGAVRHHGFIPWDDDIDLGMLREDYEKFSRLFNKNRDEKYVFISPESSDEAFVPHGKVIDTDTVLYTPDKSGAKSSVGIDVFICDNAPDDEVMLNKMFKRRQRLSMMLYFNIGAHIKAGDTAFKKLVKRFLHLIFGRFSRNKILLKINANSQKFSKSETKRYGIFSITTKERVVPDKSIFRSYVDLEFEGKMYKAPVGYDEMLTFMYGDYMKLPPVEQRVSHHHFEAYSIASDQ